MPVNITTLRSELLNDPLLVGYAPLVAVRDDDGTAALINAVRGGGNYQINREAVTPADILKIIEPQDFAAMTPTQVQGLFLLFVAGTLDLSNANVRANLLAVIPAVAGTKTAITNFSKRQGSRAEVLFGNGEAVTSSQVAQALNAP